MPQQTGTYGEIGALRYVTDAGAAEQQKIVKATPGKLFTLQVVNVNVATRYLYLFNNTTAAGTALLTPPLAIPAGGSVTVEFTQAWAFDVGLVVAASTTQATYTAGGADFMMAVLYK